MKIQLILTSALIVSSLLSCDTSQERKELLSETQLLASSQPELVITPTETYYYVNASSGLSLRSGTNLTSKKILTLPYGAQVQFVSAPPHTQMIVSGTTGEMIEVNYQGATGFAFNGYLTSLAPPQNNESIEAYSKRISTPQRPVFIKKEVNEKGKDYGMTTSIDIPAKGWNEVYKIAQQLFQLPKSINPDFTTQKTTTTILNKNKRDRTQIDELTIKAQENGSIENLTYSYNLRDYKRKVIISKSKDGFSITEEETSL